MAVAGLIPDLDKKPAPIEDGPAIVDRYIAGEITLEEFIALLPDGDASLEIRG